ncbi:CCA tRNA nucleotidyltransferase [Phycisphaerales bacterium AB-hyl4]|uniref:CCA tRNA nucleotidyltransferase n=1 Tax=Natronomicrosphaera hydrolytica TaxID=3242702 RepID=A0ABV4U9X0_9BACT
MAARDAAMLIVRELRDAGHVAYFAGGCVRDALLGHEPKDYDIATDATPEQVRALLPRSRAVGEAFGVVLVRLGGNNVEVATFRSEWGYTDKRRPDHVIFTDAEHDAKRRDFTINGLFADPFERDADTGGDRIIDYVGGRADLAARVVRAIGDPSERFSEDYLRMLRAPRFAARLNFDIEPRTAAAIRPLAKHLGQISRERIGMEVQAMLAGPRPALAVRMVHALRLDGPVLNEDHVDVPLHTLEALTRDASALPYATLLVGWLIDRQFAGELSFERVVNFAGHEAPARLRRWRKALCLSNQHHDQAKAMLALLPVAYRWSALDVARRKRLLAASAWPEALRLLRALPAAREVAALEREAQPLIEEGVAPPPLVDGNDLIKLGLTPGPAFGRLLEEVYDAQLDGRVRDREGALAWVRERARGV